MAAYAQPGFVAAVLGNDKKTIREFSENGLRTVRIPFESEYTIRLKNTTAYRAYAKIEIDGMDALAGSKLIVQPNSTLDIERFLEGSNTQGRRFKFVSANHPGVTDPTSGENGRIRVTFEPETFPTFWTYTTAHIPPGSFNGSICGSGGASSGGIYNSPAGNPDAGATHTSGFAARSMSSCSVNAGHTSKHAFMSVQAPAPVSDAGATAAGSVSGQQFSTSYEWFPTGNPVVLDIWVKGPKTETAWKLSNATPLFPVHEGHMLGGVESTEFTATHLVLRIPWTNVTRY